MENTDRKARQWMPRINRGMTINILGQKTVTPRFIRGAHAEGTNRRFDI